MSTMTLDAALEEMRDELKTSRYVVEVSIESFKRWADAIDAAIRARGEPVWVDEFAAHANRVRERADELEAALKDQP